MKIVSFLCVYNDWEFLDETLQSFKHIPDKLFIIEGAWQSSQKFGANPRSNQQTYDIIYKHVDNKKVFLIQANEPREREQRQLGLELAKQENADFLWMLDADEVYPAAALTAIKAFVSRSSPDTLQFILRSWNFINSFKRYYDGQYKRIFRVTPNAKFVMDNDVDFGQSGKTSIVPPLDFYKFYHYNYVKLNDAAFWLKMNYQLDQADEFFKRVSYPQYGYDKIKKEYKIPSDLNVYQFSGKHPEIIQRHPYYTNNVFGD